MTTKCAADLHPAVFLVFKNYKLVQSMYDDDSTERCSALISIEYYNQNEILHVL